MNRPRRSVHSPGRRNGKYFPLPPSPNETITYPQTATEVNIIRSSTFTHPNKDSNGLSEVVPLKIHKREKNGPNRESSVYKASPPSPATKLVTFIYDSSSSAYDTSSPTIHSTASSPSVSGTSITSATDSEFDMTDSLLGMDISEFMMMDSLDQEKVLADQANICYWRKGRVVMIPPPKQGGPSFDDLEAKIGLNKTPPSMKIEFPKEVMAKSVVKSTKQTVGSNASKKSRSGSSDSGVELEPVPKEEAKIDFLALPKGFNDPLEIVVKIPCPQSRKVRRYRTMIGDQKSGSSTVLSAPSASLTSSASSAPSISAPMLQDRPDIFAPEFGIRDGPAPKPPTANQRKLPNPAATALPRATGKRRRETVEPSKGDFIGTKMGIRNPLSSNPYIAADFCDPPILEDEESVTRSDQTVNHDSQQKTSPSVKFADRVGLPTSPLDIQHVLSKGPASDGPGNQLNRSGSKYESESEITSQIRAMGFGPAAGDQGADRITQRPELRPSVSSSASRPQQYNARSVPPGEVMATMQDTTSAHRTSDTFVGPFYKHTKNKNGNVGSSTQNPIQRSQQDRYSLSQHSLPQQQQPYEQPQRDSNATNDVTGPKQTQSAVAKPNIPQVQRFQPEGGSSNDPSLVQPPSFAPKGPSPLSATNPQAGPLSVFPYDNPAIVGPGKALPSLPPAATGNGFQPARVSSGWETTKKPKFAALRRMLTHSSSGRGSRPNSTQVPDFYGTPPPPQISAPIMVYNPQQQLGQQLGPQQQWHQRWQQLPQRPQPEQGPQQPLQPQSQEQPDQARQQ